MNWYPLLALVAFAYAGLCWYIIYKKPPSLMKIGKVEMFQKMLGEKGADIFYYAWGAIAAGLGIYLLILA